MATRSPVRPRARGRSASMRSRQRLGEAPRARVVEIQRSRLLAAASGAVDELGYARTTVADITERARVSRRPFYDLFANREDCLLAVLGKGVGRTGTWRLRHRFAGPAGLTSPARLADLPLASGRDPLAEVPMRLTYRTALVLEMIARHPGVSNRLAAELAGISDQGQISKLLARLARLGLIVNTGEGHHAKGEPNEWRLTDKGLQVTQTLRAHRSEEHTS